MGKGRKPRRLSREQLEKHLRLADEKLMANGIAPPPSEADYDRDRGHAGVPVSVLPSGNPDADALRLRQGIRVLCGEDDFPRYKRIR